MSGAPAGLALGALLPPISEEATPFWDGARRGELWIPRCAETGRLFFPPRPTSPFAPSVAPQWTRVSGRASLWSWCVSHPPLLPPFAALAPYAVALVALEEDPRVRLVGNLVVRPGEAIGALDRARLAIGMPLAVCFEAVDGGVVLPRWSCAAPGA